MRSGEKHLGQMRLLHWIFLVSVVLVAVAAEVVPDLEVEGQLWIIVPVLAVLGVGEIGMGAMMRRRNLEQAESILRQAPEDPKGWEKWRAGTFLGFTFAMTICLFGAVARIVVGSLPTALPFYLVAVLLLLVWSPRLPE